MTDLQILESGKVLQTDDDAKYNQAVNSMIQSLLREDQEAEQISNPQKIGIEVNSHKDVPEKRNDIVSSTCITSCSNLMYRNRLNRNPRTRVQHQAMADL